MNNIEQGIDDAHQELGSLRQRIQGGSALIYNRAIISGCTASKGASGRKVLPASGGVFAKGLEIPCAGDQIGLTIPSNSGAAALVYYGYLAVAANTALTFSLTAAGAVVPAGGIPVCRITVPSGNTAANLDGVTLTDVRRYEAAYPLLISSISYVSVALPYSMTDAGYAVLLDVTGYSGGRNQQGAVYAGDKAANGFKIFAEGSLDEVSIRWTALKLSL
jgi:hypothetical protein